MTIQKLIDFLSRHLELNPRDADVPIRASNGGEITGMGFGAMGTVLTDDYRPEHSDRSKWELFESMFKMARIPVLAHYELVNPYWPRSYTNTVLENPWWLVKTPVGLIKIGWRKRVISIDWSDTPIRAIVTDDDTTKEENMVHAWTELKAIEYLQALASHMTVTAP